MNTKLQLLVRRAKLKFARVLFLKSFYRTTVIFDTESDSMEVVENPNRNHNEGAGPAAVQLIASKGAEKIITGHLGNKAALVAKQLGMEMIPLDGRHGSVGEVIQMIKQNK